MDVHASRPASGVVVAHVDGEIDMLTAPKLRSDLAELAAPAPSVLVIDLAGVRFLGVCGITELLAIRDETTGTATSVRLVCDTQAVARPFELLGLWEVFAIFADVATACREA